MKRSADISSDGLYRYRLVREGLLRPGILEQGPDLWDERGPISKSGDDLGTALFVMLNPSTADGLEDDATIRKCVKFARTWGFGRLVVVNLYAWRATDPVAMGVARDNGFGIIGPDNDSAIARADAEAAITICAWGCNEIISAARVEKVGRLLSPSKVHCLKVTKYGAPSHPLYLPDDSEPMAWRVKPEERP